MSAIAKNNVFYGAVEPIPINDGSTSATETWSGQYLNQEFSAINSTLGDLKTLVKRVSGTTTTTGALNHGINPDDYIILGGRVIGRTECVIPRSDTYVTIRSASDLSALANTSVSVDIYYIKKSS